MIIIGLTYISTEQVSLLCEEMMRRMCLMYEVASMTSCPGTLH